MSREFKLTLGILALVAIVGGVGFLGWKMFLEPMQLLDDQIFGAQQAYRTEQKKLVRIQKQLAELQRHRLISLPANPDIASQEYREYLRKLITSSGISSSNLRQLPSGRVVQKSTSIRSTNRFGRSKKEEPVYTMIRFDQIRADASLKSLTELLRRFDRAPILHRIRSLTIEPKDRKKYGTEFFELDMDVEALIVEGAEIRSNNLLGVDERLVKLDVLIAMRGGPAGLTLIPWVLSPTGPIAQRQLAMLERKRDYRVIDDKNIFEGYRPTPPPPPTDDEGPDMKRFVYLSQIIRSDVRDEAFLRNKLTNLHIRLRFSRLFGNFDIYNETGEKKQLSGKVVRITDREVYFNVNGEIFRIGLLQTLEDAMSFPVRDEELKKLGIKIEEENP